MVFTRYSIGSIQLFAIYLITFRYKEVKHGKIL